MRLTKSTDAAIRILIFLTKNEGVTITRSISSELGIPYHNLTKIIQKLAKKQLLQTKKSKYGGIQLLKPANKINLREVVDLIDGPTILSECQEEPTVCVESSKCKLKVSFNDLQSKINDFLENIKIKDML
ncbi:MAG: Rrf2 family transcriptional regulator [bacterium]|nr:Rrf2 family transcriptional regulator [bacterium]